MLNDEAYQIKKSHRFPPAQIDNRYILREASMPKFGIAAGIDQYLNRNAYIGEAIGKIDYPGGDASMTFIPA